MTNDPGDELSELDDAYVRDLLGGLPPVAMPADLIARIDAALAAEPPLAVAAGATIVPLDSRRSRSPRILQVAAGVALLVGGSVLGIKTLGSNASTQTADSATAAASNAPRSAQNPVVVTNSGRAYTKVTLTEALARYAFQSTTTRAGPLSGPTTNNDSEALSLLKIANDPQTLATCITQVQGNPPTAQPALTVDVGTFEGKPAAVIVLSSATTATLTAYVVKPDCGSTAEPDIFYFGNVRVP